MNGIGPQLALVGILLVLNAAFAGSEIAMISLREGQLSRLEQQSGRGAVLARLAREPNRFLSTIQIGITLAGFLASATAAVALAEPLVEPLGFLGAAARPTAVFLITLGLTFVTLVIGELAPKRLAMQRPEGWAMLAARPLQLLSRVMAPVIWLLSKTTDLMVRLLGGDPRQDRQEVTDEEIRELIASESSYTPEQRQLIDGALEVGDRTLRQILTPRSRVVALPADLPADQALVRLAGAGHSRAPVFTEQLDDADRSVSALSLVDGEGSVGAYARPATVLPESLDAVSALRTLQAAHQKQALVVSEHGGVEGIVSIEDLVEELVGEIYDEHDRDVLEVQREPDGCLLVPGAYQLHDLGELGLHAEAQDATTVGGLVTEQLGRLPDPGDRVALEGVTMEVVTVAHRAVATVRIRPTADSS